jgi:hypothetical protein
VTHEFMIAGYAERVFISPLHTLWRTMSGSGSPNEDVYYTRQPSVLSSEIVKTPVFWVFSLRLTVSMCA